MLAVFVSLVCDWLHDSARAQGSLRTNSELPPCCWTPSERFQTISLARNRPYAVPHRRMISGKCPSIHFFPSLWGMTAHRHCKYYYYVHAGESKKSRRTSLSQPHPKLVILIVNCSATAPPCARRSAAPPQRVSVLAQPSKCSRRAQPRGFPREPHIQTYEHCM